MVVYMSSMVWQLEIIKTILYHITVNINTSLYSYRGVSGKYTSIYYPPGWFFDLTAADKSAYNNGGHDQHQQESHAHPRVHVHQGLLYGPRLVPVSVPVN